MTCPPLHKENKPQTDAGYPTIEVSFSLRMLLLL